MNKLKRGVIKEEVIAIVGSTMEALILNQFIYWSERIRDFDKFIKEEKERVEKFGDETTPEVKIELTHGWIYKKVAELKDELMLDDSETTIRRKIQNLIKMGYLEERNNPYIKYDRTLQYRVNLKKVVKDMFDKGYVLQDYKVDLNQLLSDTKNLHHEESKIQIEDLNHQIEELKLQNESLKLQIERAIPKTTTQTNSKTFNKPTYNKPYKKLNNRSSHERQYDARELEKKLLGEGEE